LAHLAHLFLAHSPQIGSVSGGGYVMRPPRTWANGVNEWVAGSARLTMCLTSTPRTVRASATSERWQRHGTASAHMIATLDWAAIDSRRSIPAQNSSVCM